MTQLEERAKRINDAIALKEPDRVPITAQGLSYPALNAGYTVADVFYDFDKNADSVIKYVTQYEPDNAGLGITLAGQGPILELVKPKNLAWPGAPDNRVPADSIHQFIEFAVLHDEDFEFFMEDYTGWLLKKGFPAVSGLLEGFSSWNIAEQPIESQTKELFKRLSSPSSKELIQTIWKITDMYNELDSKRSELIKKLTDLGFPVCSGGTSRVPFDTFSDYYRGTLDTMMDLYEHPEAIYRFMDRDLEGVLDKITRLSKVNPGKWVFIPLHKGMDSFLTDEQYRDFYWKYLQKIINHIIDVGMVPNIYTEGPYNSRLEYLADVPKGKVIYSFEDVDPVRAKEVLGDVACITGVFPVYLLHYGTKQEVIDEAKRLIDILAPGGGYLFSTGAGFDHAKPENVEAMFDIVKTYGKK